MRPTYSLSEHPMFSKAITGPITEVAHDLFVNSGLSYFAYIKGTSEGIETILLSNSQFSIDWLNKGFTPSIGYSPEYKCFQTFSYFWQDQLLPELISLAREKHHIYNGISIVRRCRNYFEMFAFGDANTHDMKSNYISCLGDLNNFADYFLKSASDFINLANKPPFTLPTGFKVQYHDEICLGSNQSRFQASGLLGDTTLSSLEFFALQLYVSGKSYKEVGQVLSISDKMVEKHLRNIKIKLGFHPRDILFFHEQEGTLNLALKQEFRVGNKTDINFTKIAS